MLPLGVVDLHACGLDDQRNFCSLVFSSNRMNVAVLPVVVEDVVLGLVLVHEDHAGVAS
jgi:hypothetical protein